ncbi:hypothetical protein PR048_010544 [Dryococelus australis]|uniref:Ubiquitin-like protease family profile domain-containing protein n=1 Tax=Dryococelus australis TaxID=614101 RepID=A0ABQ9I318_9NEOP|nr:hypothetical protein PR048_010544 [Dryococelus australis]
MSLPESTVTLELTNKAYLIGNGFSEIAITHKPANISYGDAQNIIRCSRAHRDLGSRHEADKILQKEAKEIMLDKNTTIGEKIAACVVVNFDISTNPGTHWVCYFKENNNIYYFDSFGGNIPNNLIVISTTERFIAMMIEFRILIQLFVDIYKPAIRRQPGVAGWKDSSRQGAWRSRAYLAVADERVRTPDPFFRHLGRLPSLQGRGVERNGGVRRGDCRGGVRGGARASVSPRGRPAFASLMLNRLVEAIFANPQGTHGHLELWRPIVRDYRLNNAENENNTTFKKWASLTKNSRSLKGTEQQNFLVCCKKLPMAYRDSWGGGRNVLKRMSPHFLLQFSGIRLRMGTPMYKGLLNTTELLDSSIRTTFSLIICLAWNEGRPISSAAP